MTSMNQHSFSVTALTWTKSDLDAVCDQARQSLQTYVEGGEEQENMRECATHLKQLSQTLSMLQVHAASLLAEEMERVAMLLATRKIPDRDLAFNLMFQGIIQLPDYLEYVASGRKDVPAVLAPLINQLRACLGDKKLADNALFFAPIRDVCPPAAPFDDDFLDNAALMSRSEYMRALFQGYLLRWIKNEDAEEALEGLLMVCDQLATMVQDTTAAQMFWTAGACFDGLLKKQLTYNITVKHAMAKTEREIKKISDKGQQAFRDEPAIDLLNHLLFAISSYAQPQDRLQDRLKDVSDFFDLPSMIVSEQENEQAEKALSGRNKALIASVSDAIKDDLLRIKDALDLHMRTHSPAQDLAPQIEAITLLSNTIGMIGLITVRQSLNTQKDVLAKIVSGEISDPQDVENSLLDIAAHILLVDANFDNQVDILSGAELATGQAERQAVQALLIKEAFVNFSKARQAVVLFIETHWNHKCLVDVPRLLDEVSGALVMMNAPESVLHFTRTKSYIADILLADESIPSPSAINSLADAMAALEYYLEAIRDRQPHTDRILSIVQSSLMDLSAWKDSVRPKPAPKLSYVDPEENIQENAQPSIASAEPLKAAPAQPALAPVAPAPPPAPAATVIENTIPAAPLLPDREIVPFDGADSDAIDDDIREIFGEELAEEIASIKDHLPRLFADKNDQDAVKMIRKSFHTIKGSGRMVGAKTLGELAWKTETLYNRVLEGNRPLTNKVLDLTGMAATHCQAFLKALSGAAMRWDVDAFVVWADALIAGAEADYVPSAVPVQSAAPNLTAEVDQARLAAEKLAAEKQEAETARLAAEKLAAEKQEAETARLAAEKLAAEKRVAQEAETARLAAEKAAQARAAEEARLAAEKQASLAAEQAEQIRLAAEEEAQNEAARLAADLAARAREEQELEEARQFAEAQAQIEREVAAARQAAEDKTRREAAAARRAEEDAQALLHAQAEAAAQAARDVEMSHETEARRMLEEALQFDATSRQEANTTPPVKETTGQELSFEFEEAPSTPMPIAPEWSLEETTPEPQEASAVAESAPLEIETPFPPAPIARPAAPVVQPPASDTPKAPVLIPEHWTAQDVLEHLDAVMEQINQTVGVLNQGSTAWVDMLDDLQGDDGERLRTFGGRLASGFRRMLTKQDALLADARNAIAVLKEKSKEKPKAEKQIPEKPKDAPPHQAPNASARPDITSGFPLPSPVVQPRPAPVVKKSWLARLFDRGN